MANRNFTSQFNYSFETQPVSLTGAATKTAGGFSSTGKGWSIAVTSTGVYTITLQDSYTTLLGASLSIQRATAVDLMPQIVSADVTTAKTVVFRTIAGATETNLATGDVVYVQLILRNSKT